MATILASVKEAKDFARTASDEQLREAYLGVKRRVERASLSGAIRLSRVSDRLYVELKSRGLQVPS